MAHENRIQVSSTFESLSDPTQLARKAEDHELDDLIFSWQRLSDPKLRKLAITIIRSMAA